MIKKVEEESTTSFLKDLEEMIKEWKKIIYRREPTLIESLKTYEDILKSKKATAELKSTANLSKLVLYNDLSDTANHMSVS